MMQQQTFKKSKGKKSLTDKSVIGLQPKYWAEDFPLEPICEQNMNYVEVDEANDFLELEIQNIRAYQGINGDFIDHGHSSLTLAPNQQL